MFRELENDRPFLKLGIEGFAGDGKTRTAAEIAIGVHKLIQSTKPIAIFDTEQAAKALVPLFKAAEIKAVTTNSRTLASLSEAMKWCADGGADILIIDSITHVWEGFKEAYKANKKKNKSFLEFQDWGIIKPQWKEGFSTPFVESPIHIIFTGRAGFEYGDEKNEDTGRREIFKVGIKMKAEAETAFEPDVLILMQKVQDLLGEDKRIYRTATILKDRSDKIDGLTLNSSGSKKGPSFDDFYPAIAALLDGTLRDYVGDEIPDTFDNWEEKFGAQNRKRNGIIAEIDGTFNLMGLGTSVDHKRLKAAILNKIFSIKSMDNLGSLSNAVLEVGHQTLSAFSDRYIKYMKECVDQEVKPEDKQIGEILDDTIHSRKPSGGSTSQNSGVLF